ncbi:hypothetical protein Tco_0682701 [Tanacetum coccineum]|uniref:Uncharacterized protein n=1 Tax=Tanacetum coccineum TaxID=301880 RepID=A0ABQ4XST9_9ASTR
MTNSKSFNKSPKQRALYHALMESILEDEDAMDEDVADKLKKRKQDDADKDEGHSARSDRELKRRKTSEDVEPSKESKSSSSKGTKSQPKSSSKSAQAGEIWKTPTISPLEIILALRSKVSLIPVIVRLLFLVLQDTKLMAEMLLGRHNKRAEVKKAVSKRSDKIGDYYNTYNAIFNGGYGSKSSYILVSRKEYDKVFNRLDMLNAPLEGKAEDTQEPQNQGQDMGKTDDQPKVKAALRHDWFKKAKRPPTPDFDWNIDNLTQEHLLGPAFNLLKGTCKSYVELEYNFEECYKAVTDRLDWNNPKGKEYPFDLSKPLPLIMECGHQVVPADFYFNNDLEYLKGGSSSKKYTTSTTKIKAAKYDIPGIEDMVPSLGSPVKASGRPSTGSRKLPEEAKYHQATDISNRTPYTAYSNPQGIIYVDKTVLHDIASNLRMDYLPKRKWSNLDRRRSRILIKAIDKLLLEIRLIRSLEKFVGGRDYREDFRLLERII